MAGEQRSGVGDRVDHAPLRSQLDAGCSSVVEAASSPASCSIHSGALRAEGLVRQGNQDGGLGGHGGSAGHSTAERLRRARGQRRDCGRGAAARHDDLETTVSNQGQQRGQITLRLPRRGGVCAGRGRADESPEIRQSRRESRDASYGYPAPRVASYRRGSGPCVSPRRLLRRRGRYGARCGSYRSHRWQGGAGEPPPGVRPGVIMRVRLDPADASTVCT